MNTADYLLRSAEDEAVSVVDAAGAHSYGELRRAVAGRVAALSGLPPRAPVALVAPNGFGWVAAYLAALSAGAVAVPIPNTLPPVEIAARLRWIDAKAAFLGQREERQLAGLVPREVRRLPADLDDRSPGQVASAAVEDDDDAVYAFTSGTTGNPRVVRLTHGNLQANTDSILNYLGLTRADRMLVVLPLSYVFGASLMHTHLRVGASLVIQPNVVFPQAIVDRLRSERCTGLAGVPSTFHMLLRNSAFGRQPLPDLRTIQQAGGKLAPPLVEELVRAQPQARVFVMYGQTEATARLSYLPPAELTARTGSIGRGIPGVELSVVSTNGRPVAPGEVGEIWARGRNISPGYLHDPEATLRKMPDGVLHTGDLATIDQDGYIFIVDRLEDFIKTWGYRVASQDVETIAIQLSDLIAVAAVGVPDAAAGERVELVAVMRPGSSIGEEQVLRHCREHLAKHMVPTRVHFVAQLPLNPNGKVVKAEVRDLCLRLGTNEN